METLPQKPVTVTQIQTDFLTPTWIRPPIIQSLSRTTKNRLGLNTSREDLKGLEECGNHKLEENPKEVDHRLH